MTHFIGELLDIAGSPFEDGQSRKNRIIEIFTKQFAQSGLVVGQQVATFGLGGNSLTGTIERFVDPNVRSSKPDERYYYIPSIGLQPMIRGAYEALNNIRSRIPILFRRFTNISKQMERAYNARSRSCMGNICSI